MPEDLKALPHDTGAEMGVLGSMMLSPEAAGMAKRALRPGQFYALTHQEVFTALCALLDEERPPDLLLLRRKLQDAGTLEKVGGSRYLTDLMEAVPTSANAGYYVRIVQEKAAQRQIIAICGQTLGKAYRERIDWGAFGTELEAVLSTFDRGQANIPLIREHLAVASERMERRSRGEDVGLRTGIGVLDRKIGGIEPGEFVLVLGESSSGKTAFLCNILLDIARRGEPSTLFFSAEVIGPTLAIDMARIIGRRDFWHLTGDGKLSQSDYEAWQAAQEELGRAMLYVDDTAGISIEELVDRAGRMVEDKAVGLVAVDFVQLLTTEKRCESEILRIDYIGQRLKRLGGRYRVPVIALSQMSVNEGRRDPRYCKALMHYADLRIDILRAEPAYDRDPQDEPDICRRKIILAKGRHKGTGWGTMEFNKPILTFLEVSDGHGEDSRGTGRDAGTDVHAQRKDRRTGKQACLDRAPDHAGAAETGDEGFDVPDDEIPF